MADENNPLIAYSQSGGLPLAYAPWTPETSSGGMPNTSGMLSSLVSDLPARAPRPVRSEPGFNPATNELFVNGFRFTADDAQRALESEQYLSQTPQALPSGFTPMPVEAYQQYLQGIKDPTLSRLAAKNFGRGVDTSQLLLGRGLQFAGAEETGQRLAEAQLEDLRKTSPYERMATDIGEPNRGVLDWFVANLAQQGPNMVEAVVTAALGAGAGALAGGGPNPLSAAGGALASLAGRQSVKQAVLAAAKKYQKGEVLNAAEAKLLREQAGVLAAAQIKAAQTSTSTALGAPLTGAAREITENTLARQRASQIFNAQYGRLGAGAEAATAAGLQQARIAGVAGATTLQNYATGVADIYGEGIEAGDPDRATAAKLGIPYAALESVPEFFLAGKIFGIIGANKPRLRDLPTLQAKAAAVGKRAGLGFVGGGLAEGATEAGQEGLLLAANEGVDWNSQEGISRLVNSFAAGFGVGGPIGAVANLKGNAPANLLKPAESPEPTAATSPWPRLEGEVIPAGSGGLQPYTGPQGGFTPPDMPGPQPPQTGPTSGGVTFGPAPAGLPAPAPAPVPAQVLQPGQQGTLDLFPMSQAEMAQRMQPTEYAPVESTQLPPEVSPGQGALQFAPAAPEGMRFTGEAPPPQTAMGQQIYEQQAALRRQQEFEAAMQQRQTQEEAQREADFQAALNQQQLQMGQVATPAAVVPTRTRQAGATTPQQLPLFKRQQAPRPSRGEGLRRGATPPAAQQAPAERPTPGESYRAGQLPMFTQAGEPSVAALKGAALQRGKITPTEEKGGKQIPPVSAEQTRKNIVALKKAAKDAEAKAKVEEAARKKAEDELKAAEQAKAEAEAQAKAAEQARQKAEEEARAIQEREAAAVSARKPTETGEGVGGQVPSKREPSGTRTTPKAEKEPGQTPNVQRTLAKGRLAQAGKLWGSYGDAKWADLSPEQQERWAKVAIDGGKPNIADAMEIEGAAIETPVPLELKMSDGSTLKTKDGKKLLAKLEADIKKYEQLLNCIKGA